MMMLLAAACIARGVEGQSTADVKIDSYGIYRSVPDDRRVELVKQTQAVEARHGTVFGYHYVVSGLRAGEPITFHMTKRYPPMRMPNGTISRWHDREMPTTVRSDGTVAGYLIFGFDHDYEMVHGTWTLELWHLTDKLATMTFEVK